jgi:hypothetical protein
MVGPKAGYEPSFFIRTGAEDPEQVPAGLAISAAFNHPSSS